MIIVQPEVQVESVDSKAMLQRIEKAGRTCYKSEDKITEDSCYKFIQMVINNGHHSVLEHEKFTARFICDRGVSHEIVRHRLAAYSQESTRYCNYSKDKFGESITVVDPFFFEGSGIIQDRRQEWKMSCLAAERAYFNLLKLGASPQEARSVLPNSLKTEIVVTYDLREWRHFFSLRAAKPAHPQMKQLAIPLLAYMKEKFEPIFDGIGWDQDFAEQNSPWLAQIIEA